MEAPKFSQLRLLYPGCLQHGGTYSTDDVIQLVLGVSAALPDDSRESVRHGDDAVRLSWTLNRYGGRHAIGRVPVGEDSFTGADGQQYIFRPEAFSRYLAARYGDPLVHRPRPDAADPGPAWRPRQRRAWRELAGRQGIARVVRYVDGRKDSHVALWDCGRFYESRDWSSDPRVVTVEFWEAAGACRPVFKILFIIFYPLCLQCSDTVGWAAGRASGL